MYLRNKLNFLYFSGCIKIKYLIKNLLSLNTNNYPKVKEPFLQSLKNVPSH